MFLNIFPISGEYRIPLLAMEWMIFLLSLELGFIFLIRYNKQEHKQKNNQELAYMSLFIGYGTMIFFFIVSDYYSSTVVYAPFIIWNFGSFRDLFINIGYFSMLLGTLSFIIINENIKQYFKIKNLFTFVFSSLVLVDTILFFYNLSFPKIILLFFWISFLIFFIKFFIDFTRLIRERKSLLKGMLRFFSPFVLLIFGFFLSIDFTVEVFSLYARFIGSMIQTISIVYMFFTFIKLPSISELEWKKDISEIYILNKEGACLFYKPVKKELVNLEKNLITGAITSVKLMLDELVQSNKMGLSVIKKEENIITIYATELLIGVIISTTKLENINNYLKKFVEKLESIYLNFLTHWDGNLEIFSPIEDIMNEIFGI